MKKSLIGVLTVLALVCHAEWQQCRNCGKHFKGDSIIGYNYCRKNACQKVREKEGKEEFQSLLKNAARRSERFELSSKMVNRTRKYLQNAKQNNIPALQQVKEIMNIAMKSPYNLEIWEMVIAYADMEVIKICWPSPDNKQVYFNSSQRLKKYEKYAAHGAAWYDIRRRSKETSCHRVANVAFALGRHQKTGGVRFVEGLGYYDFSHYYLYCAVKYGRADILNWFFKQMDGIDDTEFYILLDMLKKERDHYAKNASDIKSHILKLKSEKENAADKYQEKEISKKIAIAQRKLKQVPKHPENYRQILVTISNNVNDKNFQIIVTGINDLNKLRKSASVTPKDALGMRIMQVYVAPEYWAKIKADSTRTNSSTLSGRNLNFAGGAARFSSLLSIAIEWLSTDPRGKKVMDLYKTLGVFSWKANLPNRKRIGVCSDQKENTWKAAPGFELSKDGKAVWKAGLPHPQYEGLISAKEIFTWIPDAKHAWKNPAAAEDLSTQEDLDPVSNFLIKTEKRSQHNYRSY